MDCYLVAPVSGYIQEQKRVLQKRLMDEQAAQKRLHEIQMDLLMVDLYFYT
jgi:hypothetical protein